MKEVTMYSIKKHKVLTTNDHVVVQHTIPYQALGMIDGLYYDKRQVEIEHEHIPVRVFTFACEGEMRRTVYAAFDEELLELIGCTEREVNNRIYKAVSDARAPLESELVYTKTELKTLQNLSLWGWIGKLSKRLIQSRNKGKHHE